MSYPSSQPGHHDPYHQQPYQQQPTEPVRYQQPAGYGPPLPPPLMPPQPPKRRGMHPLAIVGIVVGVLIVVCVGVGTVASLGAEEEPETSANEQPEAQAPESEDAEPAAEDERENGDEGKATAGIGDAVRDGKFEFTITEVETGIDAVGDEFLGKEAQGQFVFVYVTVENIGDEAQLFDGSSQYLIDTEGREHSSDGEAAFYVENSDSFLTEINPGNTVEGIVVFDIPADATPASLNLHDSFLSGGVEVLVGGA